MRSIILGLKTEFVTLIVEIALVDIEKQQWSREKVPILVQKFDKLFILTSKNVTYCAKAPFQSAKERLTELRGLGDKLEEHQIRQTIEEAIVEAKLTVGLSQFGTALQVSPNRKCNGGASPQESCLSDRRNSPASHFFKQCKQMLKLEMFLIYEQFSAGNDKRYRKNCSIIVSIICERAAPPATPMPAETAASAVLSDFNALKRRKDDPAISKQKFVRTMFGCA
uniref:Uncharacterized protein n=1 Tax=Globodera rostochiensis TaxID=31243 RepID=A0A914HL41_GLORO